MRKPYLRLRGKPVLTWTLSALSRVRELTQIVIVTRPDDRASAQTAARRAALPKRIRVDFADGGPRRQDSVFNGLQATAPDCEIVLIHDAARPFPSREAMEAACAAARASGAAILAQRVKDTVKREMASPVTRHPSPVTRHPSPVTLETVLRQGLWLAQTPQVFWRDLILTFLARLNHEEPEREVTDDAAACEHFGWPVALVESPETNLKITRPQDIALAEAYLKAGLV